MRTFLPGFEINPLTWIYLSSVLIVAVYMRFSRIWSLRNVDLLLLLSASPGLLMVEHDSTRNAGYVWMFAVSGLYLARLLLDGVLSRRPVLGQNLNGSGLAFLCGAAFLLLAIGALQKPLPPSTMRVVEQANQMLQHGRQDSGADTGVATGPAAVILAAPARMVFREYAARSIAVLAHLAVALGLLFAGKSLFNHLQLGLAMATLYLLHPATAFDVGAVTHVLPAALIVWAFVSYRRPLLAGMLLGLACGTLFFPLFLLPIWLAFYGRRSALQFGTSLLVVAAGLASTLVLTTPDPDSFLRRLLGTIHVHVLQFEGHDGFQGIWSIGGNGWFRVPVMVTYAVMLTCLTIWPRRKNVEHLITSSAAAIVGTQFWYPLEGGIYVLWYLPLLLMVVFRPRLFHLTPPGQLESDQAQRRNPLTESQARNSRTAASSFRRAQLYR